MNERNKRLVRYIDLKQSVGLELGPLTAPVVSKSDGEIYYLDHMSQEDLKKKYKNEPVDPNKIVRVDYVLKETLENTVGEKRFDYIVASHVIEHIPDTITWLKDVMTILKPGGILSLAIPDKRFTFDFDRNLSDSSDVIGAFMDGLKKPTSAMMYDYITHCADGIDSTTAWRDKDYYINNPPVRRWTHKDAIDMCQRNLKKGEYVDCHCYVYTPTSFTNILRDLTQNGLIDFELFSFQKTAVNELEFYVMLKKPSSKVSVRQRLQKIPVVADEQDTYSSDIESLESHIKLLEEKILAFEGSLSWTVTAPLRKVSGAVKRKHRR